MGNLYSNSIFWIDVDKINPNPYQPRREFDEARLQELADSIRQYGVLQPLVVTRSEVEKPDGGLATVYELIAGERRLRASRLAGIREVPVVIRTGDDSKMKLELAIIENLQREDLNSIDRAKAFMRLVDEFGLTHSQIGQKMGRSREYVSNTLRLLSLPEEIMQALAEGKITEGHTRPLMMLVDRPAEQHTLFKELLYKKMSVRETERIARDIAHDKVRKINITEDPKMQAYQQSLAEKLGTRVHIEKKDVGGKIVIDYFTAEDLASLVALLEKTDMGKDGSMLDRYIANTEKAETVEPVLSTATPLEFTTFEKQTPTVLEENNTQEEVIKTFAPPVVIPEKSPESLDNFSLRKLAGYSDAVEPYHEEITPYIMDQHKQTAMESYHQEITDHVSHEPTNVAVNEYHQEIPSQAEFTNAYNTIEEATPEDKEEDDLYNISRFTI
ncbi:MAG: ParB/RepB/Spo0J family partition protein [Candidatus Pacebacteria bacterium]|nr:ParB/RepB/Spo0J family partition protein [Candidatus Paceibacterota bacterium]